MDKIDKSKLIEVIAWGGMIAIIAIMAIKAHRFATGLSYDESTFPSGIIMREYVDRVEYIYPGNDWPRVCVIPKAEPQLPYCLAQED